jgi:hypothetical protein
MKTTTNFVLVAFLLLLGCSQNDDDLNANLNNDQQNSTSLKQLNDGYDLRNYPYNNFSVSHWFESSYWIPINCGGDTIGYLEGNCIVHCSMFGHYDPDFPKGTPYALNYFVWKWMVMEFRGTLTSNSGEVFKIQEVDKYFADTANYTFHANIVGDKGTHFILSGSGLLVAPWTFNIDKAVCPGNIE